MGYAELKYDGKSVGSVDLDGAITVGRQTGCDIVVAHDSLSRQHFRIGLSPEGWTALDLNSRTGTMVEGELSDRRVLADGDVIEAGPLTVLFFEVRPHHAVASLKLPLTLHAANLPVAATPRGYSAPDTEKTDASSKDASTAASASVILAATTLAVTEPVRSASESEAKPFSPKPFSPKPVASTNMAASSRYSKSLVTEAGIEEESLVVPISRGPLSLKARLEKLPRLVLIPIGTLAIGLVLFGSMQIATWLFEG